MVFPAPLPIRHLSTLIPNRHIFFDFTLKAVLFATAFFVAACSEITTPVKPTGSTDEYGFNYWLLNRTYLFEDELPQLKEEGDSVQELYRALSDPYTRYIVPTQSSSVSQQINTSIVQGDVGMEYMLNLNAAHPLFVYRVYPKGPAGKAGVPRYGNIISVNGIELKGDGSVYHTYDSVLTYNKTITLEISFDGKSSIYEMEKGNVYAPTVFVDTLSGVPFILIKEFKLNTEDQQNGTYGELKAYLDSTQGYSGVRVLDLRGNPGGHVNQCLAMADLFVKEGTLSTRHMRIFDGEGNASYHDVAYTASPGDAGEDGKFILLVNGGTASCGEIFTAAVAEAADVRIAGTKTFGKGIGQTTWHTMEDGLAIITNMDFLTPKKNSYHKKGIYPDYPCGQVATVDCGLEAIEKYFGKKAILKKASEEAHFEEPKIIRRYEQSIGGAMLPYSEDF